MTSKKSTSERVAAHRDNLRAAGLRPIQIWVPDARAPEIAEEAKSQAKTAARSKAEKGLMVWITGAQS